MRGIFRVKVYRKGRMIEDYEEHNLITNYSRNMMARYLAGEDGDLSHIITHVALGTNGTVPSGADTEITNPFVTEITAFSYPGTGEIRFDWEVGYNENNGTAIHEFGLLTDDGSLFARRTRQAPINKDSDIFIEGHWSILF
jgi:hypothetical protein